MEMTLLASVDPPAAARGRSGLRAPEAHGQNGGVSGFPLEVGSAWHTTMGDPDCINDLNDILLEVEENPHKRSAAHLLALERLRAQLLLVPEESDLDTTVEIPLVDAALLARWLLGRLR